MVMIDVIVKLDCTLTNMFSTKLKAHFSGMAQKGWNRIEVQTEKYGVIGGLLALANLRLELYTIPYS